MCSDAFLSDILLILALCDYQRFETLLYLVNPVKFSLKQIISLPKRFTKVSAGRCQRLEYFEAFRFSYNL